MAGARQALVWAVLALSGTNFKASAIDECSRGNPPTVSHRHTYGIPVVNFMCRRGCQVTALLITAPRLGRLSLAGGRHGAVGTPAPSPPTGESVGSLHMF